MERVSQLMTSDIGHLLERAEDPGAAIETLIGDLEEAIVDLRREMVTAVARQNRIRTHLFTAEEAAGRIEREASMALACGEELKARHALSRGIRTLTARDELEVELAAAGRTSARLVAALIRIEDRAQLARRKRGEIGRRRRPGTTGGRRGAPAATRAVRGPLVEPAQGRTFDGYVEAVRALEHEAARATDDEGGGRC
jgi:phage shock protein A